MDQETRQELTNEVVSRVLNNAPASELLRVYSLSVQSALEGLSEEGLFECLLNAGFTDLVEKYGNMEKMIDD
jgi:hypothetical protein